jgi:hypothetical protein
MNEVEGSIKGDLAEKIRAGGNPSSKKVPHLVWIHGESRARGIKNVYKNMVGMK